MTGLPEAAAAAGPHEQFEILAAMLNHHTFRHIRALGIEAGWHCWEAGAGGADTPAWLSEQVGPSGRVLATDIDTSSLDDVPNAGFEVRRHDLTTDPPPGVFDLVHARLVLEHLSAPDVALRTLITAVRPGGWLLLECSDPRLQPLACPDQTGPPQALANKLRNLLWELMSQRSDLSMGRTLPRLLRDGGLVDTGADAAFGVGGPVARRLQRALVTHGGPALMAVGLASADEIDRHLCDLESDGLDVVTFPVVSAWGRKRSQAQPTGDVA